MTAGDMVHYVQTNFILFFLACSEYGCGSISCKYNRRGQTSSSALFFLIVRFRQMSLPPNGLHFFYPVKPTNQVANRNKHFFFFFSREVGLKLYWERRVSNAKGKNWTIFRKILGSLISFLCLHWAWMRFNRARESVAGNGKSFKYNRRGQWGPWRLPHHALVQQGSLPPNVVHFSAPPAVKQTKSRT